MCIYHFIFFTNDLLVAVYFVFILDYENDITQKQIQVIFLLKFKMDCKEAETTRNINILGLHVCKKTFLRREAQSHGMVCIEIVTEASLVVKSRPSASEG